MKTPKLGKWISAAKVRLVKKNGVKVLEIRRTVKRKTVKNAGPKSRRKTKKTYSAGWARRSVDRAIKARDKERKAKTR